MKILGRHLIVEFTGCDTSTLDNLKKLRKIMRAAAVMAGATIVNTTAHRYAPHGVTVMVVISESHLSVHSWPEYGYAAVDIFTCGESVDPYKALECIKQELGAADVQVKELARGIPSSTTETLAHK